MPSSEVIYPNAFGVHYSDCHYSPQIHVPYPKDKFEPLLAVLRSLKKHHLYKVTLVPLSLAIEKMFPNAMTRFGVGSIEEYITQAQEAGLVTTGSTANGNLWVSLSENMDTGSVRLILSPSIGLYLFGN